MKRIALLMLLIAACGPSQSGVPKVSRDPISVRGWIADEETPRANDNFRTVETEAARLNQLFRTTDVWVDGAPYVSGGMAETGAFLLLDVPPGNVTITFRPEGQKEQKLVLQNVPANADVVIPGILLTPNGVQLSQPDAVKVRMAARVAKPIATAQKAVIAGHPVPIVNTPIAEMVDRRDWPTPPRMAVAPLATVK